MTLWIGDKAKGLPSYYETIGCATSLAGHAVSISTAKNLDTGETFRCHRLEVSDPSISRTDLYQALRYHRRVSGHPNIGGLLEAYEDSRFLYSLTEHFEQVPLPTYQAGALHERTVANWTLGVVNALVHCHRQGIVHGSVTPDSIVLTTSSIGTTVKVIGFESSCQYVNDSCLLWHLARTPYSAPEVTRGHVTPAADVWSLGCVVCKLLFGWVPFGVANGSGCDTMDAFLQSEEWQKLSEELKQFLHTVFAHPEAKSRPQASQLIHHPWLRLSGQDDDVTGATPAGSQRFSVNRKSSGRRKSGKRPADYNARLSPPASKISKHAVRRSTSATPPPLAEGEGQDVVALSPASVAPLTKPDAQVPQGGMATGLLHAGPAAKRPTPDAAAADINLAEGGDQALSRSVDDGNHSAKSSASLGGRATDLLQAGPIAKQPAPDGAAAGIPQEGAAHPQDVLGPPGQEDAGGPGGTMTPHPSTTGLQAGPAAKLSVRDASAAATKLPEVVDLTTEPSVGTNAEGDNGGMHAADAVAVEPHAQQQLQHQAVATADGIAQDIVPAQGKVGGGGVLGNRLHHEGNFAIGTLVERWWPHHGGWTAAKVTAYSKGSHTLHYKAKCKRAKGEDEQVDLSTLNDAQIRLIRTDAPSAAAICVDDNPAGALLAAPNAGPTSRPKVVADSPRRNRQAASKAPTGGHHTLGRLLKSKGQGLVGNKMWLRWSKDKRWYKATVEGYNPSNCKHQVVYAGGSFEELQLSQFSNSLIRQHEGCVISQDEAIHTPVPSVGHKAEQKEAAGRGKSVARPTAAASRPASKPASKPAPVQQKAAGKKSKASAAAVTKPVSTFVQALQHLDEIDARWRQAHNLKPSKRETQAAQALQPRVTADLNRMAQQHAFQLRMLEAVQRTEFSHAQADGPAAPHARTEHPSGEQDARLAWEQEKEDLRASQAADRQILLSLQEQLAQQGASVPAAPAPTAEAPSPTAEAPQAAEQPPLAQAAAQPGRHWGFAEACAELWKPYHRNREADKLYKSRKFTDAELHGHHS